MATEENSVPPIAGPIARPVCFPIEVRLAAKALMELGTIEAI